MRPRTLFTAGGGRHNATMMHMLAERTGISIRPVNELGWNGDALEAQGFAYMAVRTLRGLPISFPGTTSVPEPMCGGRSEARRVGKEGVSKCGCRRAAYL